MRHTNAIDIAVVVEVGVGNAASTYAGLRLGQVEGTLIYKKRKPSNVVK